MHTAFQGVSCVLRVAVAVPEGVHRQEKGAEQTIGAGLPLPDQIVSRTVIGGSTDGRQPGGKVDALSETERLKGHQPLIVVHRQYPVELPLLPAAEEAVGGVGAHRHNTCFFGCLHRRSHDGIVLRTDFPPVPGMWVQGEYGDQGAVEPEVGTQTGIHDLQLCDDLVLCDGARHLRNRDMVGYHAHPQFVGNEEHETLLPTQSLGQHLGVAGVGEGVFRHDRLIDRGGDEGVDGLRLQVGHATFERAGCGPSPGGGRLSG